MKKTLVLARNGIVLSGIVLLILNALAVPFACATNASRQVREHDIVEDAYASLFRPDGREGLTARGREDADLAPDQLPLQSCWDDALGLKMLCHRDWGLYEEEDTMLIIISRDPAVTMTIARIDDKVKFLSQLTKDYLDQMGQYQNGFRVDEGSLGGERSLKVKAFSRSYPEIRLLDYYLVHDGGLYGVLFSVNPRSEWENYKFLIEKLARSIIFLERGSFQTGRL